MTSRPHSRTAPILCASIVVAAFTVSSVAASPGAAGDLFVTGDVANVVREFQGTSGTSQGNFCVPFSANGPMSVHFDATGSRMLFGSTNGGVEERNGATGAYIKTYAPAGGWQWGAIYAPTGGVYIGSMATDDVREYDSTTGAFIRVVTNVYAPADMRIGPNGHLYICSYGGGFVLEIHAVSGLFVSLWNLPPSALANDIAFLPSGEILVTAMRTNVVYRYDAAHNLLGTFSNALWGNPHGIVLSPYSGHILVSDGVTGQVHEFDPATFVELNAAFLVPAPGDKIVDLEFKPGGAVRVAPMTWGAVKRAYR